MTVLTVYTDRFDSRENIFGTGMSGKVFLEEANGNSESGQEFKTIDDALNFCDSKHVKIDRMDFMYLSPCGTQKFAKFLSA